MRLRGFIYWSVILFCTFSFCAHAQEEDVWNISLDSLVVKSYQNTSLMKTNGNGKVTWDLRQMESLPKILGNADPVRYAQMLPGVQTNNEFSAGLRIQGCDNQHNVITVGEVPIYNINHLLGFFSSFVSSHYPVMELTKSPASVQMANRLGSELTMELPDSIPSSVNGEVSLGLISSQGTLRIPVTRRLGVTLSLRGSYMNLLYGHWLREGDHRLRYSFFDSNVTIDYRVNSRNRIIFDSYWGMDRANFSEESYLAKMKARWGNQMASLHWHHCNDHGVLVRNTVFATRYHNLFQLHMTDMVFRLPSSILDIGYKGYVTWQRWNAGIEAIMHEIQPQALERTGSYNEFMTDAEVERPLELSMYGEYTLHLSDRFKAIGGVRGSVFNNTGISYWGIDPLLLFCYDNMDFQFSISCYRKHQYLFQTGFSDMGLPTEFWMPSRQGLKPQVANAINISLNHYFLNRRYKVSADVYYKKLDGQIEYSGSVLNLMNTVYSIDESLLHGQGENYGYSLLLNKCSGSITGWVGYSYTHSARTFNSDGHEGRFPSNHSRPHEVNLVVTYSPNNHWDFGATLVYASGTPFTVAESLSLINGNILVQYGEHNGKRLSPYARADISINYTWTHRTFKENSVNFSLYNLTCHNNELFYYLKSHHDGRFAYRPVHSILKLLPSLSYYCKF